MKYWQRDHNSRIIRIYKEEDIITIFFEIILILFFCQSCTFNVKHSNKPFISPHPEPVIEETAPVSAKPSTAIQPKAVSKGTDKAPEEKLNKKRSPITRVEALMKKREWKKIDKEVDQWKITDQRIKGELKSHIGLVQGFLTGYDNCEQMESSSSTSKKVVVDCYVKLLELNWNRLPQRSYFSRDFAAHLTAKRNTVMKKLKKLRLAQDLEIIKEDDQEKAIKGIELEKSKK
jgi:hypothetical protein